MPVERTLNGGYTFHLARMEGEDLIAQDAFLTKLVQLN